MGSHLNNTLNSTKVSVTIGKNIWLSNISLLKVNWNSQQSSLFQREHHSICSKERRNKTESLRLSERTSSRNVLNSSMKSLKTRKTGRNFMKLLVKTSNSVSMKIPQTAKNLQNF